jgi:predicted nucleotide-binding protein
MEDNIKKLIAEGKILAPKGGSEFGGYNGELQPDYVSWRLQVFSVLDEIGKPAKILLNELEKDKNGSYFYSSSASRILGVLNAALVIVQRKSIEKVEIDNDNLTSDKKLTNSVFIVHGHDEALLQNVARFTEKLNLKPIILFEQPGKSKTIVEKLESYSNTNYAIVLFTPDDIGKGAKDEHYNPRARQNVVLELGFFIGKLKRENVCVLYDESVELPSDYRGVEYIKIDLDGAWKLKLAKELKSSGLSIDMNNAI